MFRIFERNKVKNTNMKLFTIPDGIKMADIDGNPLTSLIQYNKCYFLLIENREAINQIAKEAIRNVYTDIHIEHGKMPTISYLTMGPGIYILAYDDEQNCYYWDKITDIIGSLKDLGWI